MESPDPIDLAVGARIRIRRKVIRVRQPDLAPPESAVIITPQLHHGLGHDPDRCRNHASPGMIYVRERPVF
ncbi:hypothetical protein [Phenylobacterium sp.]|uniref:hypothetical protein n=1 Tax=Phenylobacterium sp. TaxID=1871053 RepID=UPI003BABB777